MLDDEIAVDEDKTEIKTLDARRKELQAQLETADEPPPLLHPEMADLYRTKVATMPRPWSSRKPAWTPLRRCEGLSTPSS